MLYQAEVTIPSGTSKGGAMEQVLPLTHGVITQIDVILPAGCYGLVGIQIYRLAQQIFPLTAGEWFTGDDVHIAFSEEYEIEDRPWELIIKGYNEDDTFDHSPIVKVMMRGFEEDVFKQLGGVIERRVDGIEKRADEMFSELSGKTDTIILLLEKEMIPTLRNLDDRLGDLVRAEVGKPTLADLSTI